MTPAVCASSNRLAERLKDAEWTYSTEPRSIDEIRTSMRS
jgi:hypothetical protein